MKNTAMPRLDKNIRTVAAEPIRLKNVLEFLRKPRVLVADDDPTTGSCLSALAGSDNYEIVSVCDGAEAYRLLKSDADFCAAVINLTMPNIHGLDILRYIEATAADSRRNR